MAEVAILLTTFNGDRFLRWQLESFEQQTLTDWKLYVSDDGSSDHTWNILAAFQERWGDSKVSLRRGPQQGFVANFLSLARAPDINGSYCAFSDQDDIWEHDKLERALAWLRRQSDAPALHCSRTRLIDEEGRSVGFSPLFRRKPSFRNAIVQSIAGGNTMVFNRAARDLLCRCPYAADLPSHDWWLYLLTTAVGGHVRYDPHPSTQYRIHRRNVIGSNKSLFSRAQRLRMLLAGRFRSWSDANIRFLAYVRPAMPPENGQVFDAFCRARSEDRPMRRLCGMLRSGVYRQTMLGNLGLALAALLRKI